MKTVKNNNGKLFNKLCSILNDDLAPIYQKIKENIHKSSHKKFKPLFDEFNPDFIQNYVNDLFNTVKTKCCLTGWVELFRGNYEVVLYLIKKEEDCIKTKEYSNFEANNLDKIWKS